GVEVTSSLPSLTISHAQPLPKRASPAAFSFSFRPSILPKVLLISSSNLPEGAPPLELRISQKKLWFQCPPALLRTAGLIVPAFATSSSRDLFSFGVPAIALFRLST